MFVFFNKVKLENIVNRNKQKTVAIRHKLPIFNFYDAGNLYMQF